MSLILFIIYLNVDFLKNKSLFKQDFLLFELLLINFKNFLFEISMYLSWVYYDGRLYIFFNHNIY